MIEYRPVDCDTQQPLPTSPAYMDKSVIYSGGPRPGWSWFPQSASNATLITPSRERYDLAHVFVIGCVKDGQMNPRRVHMRQ